MPIHRQVQWYQDEGNEGKIGKVVDIMLYKFASFPDGTEISYSEPLKDQHGKEALRIFIERWDDRISDFDTLEFFLPSMEITKQKGFTADEIAKHLRHIKNLSSMLFEISKEEVLCRA